ncbi:MAG: hypothetical protein AAGE65_04805 [Planctomycetota bacterium]
MKLFTPFRVAAVLLGSGVLVFSSCAQTPPPASDWPEPVYDEGFAEVWYDGQAEIAAYDLVYPRYGEMRRGNAVAVTVTERFRWAPRVKADTPDDAFGVVKLNLSEDFPTGIYDYNLMTSAFVAAEPIEGLRAGVPVKLTFSSQEWCGQAWQQAVFDRQGVEHEHRSYFEAGADQNELLPGYDAYLAEDALFLWARGLAGPQVEPGESVEIPLYRSAAVTRLRHLPVAWDAAVLTRVEGTSRVHSEAIGNAEVFTLHATIRRSGLNEQAKYIFTVEAQAPHRVIQMARNDGYTLTLKGVSREPYWRQSSNADRALLENFGMSPRPPLTP